MTRKSTDGLLDSTVTFDHNPVARNSKIFLSVNATEMDRELK